MLLINDINKKNAAKYYKQYIQTEEDPFIIRNQIRIPITSRFKEPNPERYGNTVCDDYIEYIPKSRVFHKKIFPSFSTRDHIQNFRVQKDQVSLLSNNENSNIYIKELPVYLCFNDNTENKDVFQTKYNMIIKIELNNQINNTFSCLISIRSMDIDILFNYQYHFTPYSYRSFINKHIIPQDIKDLASKNIYLSFKKYISYLKHIIDNCVTTTNYKVRLFIPKNSNNDIIKLIFSNHQEHYLYYDILSLFMFQSPLDKIYKDVNEDYIRIKKLHKVSKSQLIRFANSLSIHAPSIFINELQKNNLPIFQNYNLKSKSYWMNILENCFRDENIDNINNNNNTNNSDMNKIQQKSLEFIKIFDNNVNQMKYIVNKKQNENIKLTFKQNYFNNNNDNNKENEIAKSLINNDYEFEYKIPITVLTDNNQSFQTSKLILQLKRKDNNYYIIIYNEGNILFNYMSEEFNEYILDNMMEKLHIKLINYKVHSDKLNNIPEIYNESKPPIKFIINELLEKCDKQNEKYQCYLYLSKKSNDLDGIIINRVKSCLPKPINSELNDEKLFNGYNYGNLLITKTTSLKQQIIFTLKINIFPKIILSEYLQNKYYLLSEEITTFKIKIYTLIDAVRNFNSNIFKYVDLPEWSLEYARGRQKTRIF